MLTQILPNNDLSDDNKNNVKIVIYARTAVYDIQKLNDQIKSCSGLISSKGWRLDNVAVYADNGYSGWDEQRPEFQRMLHDIDSGMYQLLVVEDLNRLSRNISHLRRIVDELIRKKIQIFIVNGNPMLTKEINQYHILDLLTQIAK